MCVAVHCQHLPSLRAARAHDTAQRRPFVPPTKPIRVTTHIDLMQPSTLRTRFATILAPVSKLPLEGPDAIHRCKVIAGSRWTPYQPGKTSLLDTETEEGKDGWIKITESRFEEMRMNRKSASDMLDRLVSAANVSRVDRHWQTHMTGKRQMTNAQDSNSPVTKDVPLDMRHIYGRRASRAGLTHEQFAARTSRKTVDKLGFPADWVSDEIKQKALQGRRRVLA